MCHDSASNEWAKCQIRRGNSGATGGTTPPHPSTFSSPTGYNAWKANRVFCSGSLDERANRLVGSRSWEGNRMVKAVISQGEIRPLEPLPADWGEGQALRVEKIDDGEPPPEELDRDFADLASMCQSSDPTDEERLERALQEARRQAKEQVRRQMGLS